MFDPAPAQALAVQTSSSDLAFCLVVNICMVLGKIVSSHNVLLFPFIFTHSVTVNPEYIYYSQLQITSWTHLMYTYLKTPSSMSTSGTASKSDFDILLIYRLQEKIK